MSNNLDFTEEKGPVTCLGKNFANDDERRTYFTELLRQKLKDPEFRKIEGFPIGADEDILALSDPPYYTACPNPWMGAFIEEWEQEKPSKPEGYKYHREPFSKDLRGSKYVPLYKIHSYHTKVPYPMIMEFLIHYTNPGDIIFDGFSGTGMTGVAAKMLATPPAELRKEFEENDPNHREKWGKRHVIQSELSPIATFISANYVTPKNSRPLEETIINAFNELKNKCEDLYTIDINNQKCRIQYIVWSEVILCNSCSHEFSLWDGNVSYNLSKKIGIISDNVTCPKCNHQMNPRNLEKAFITYNDNIAQDLVKTIKYTPVLINYMDEKGKKLEIIPDAELSKTIFSDFSTYSNGLFRKLKIPFSHETHERHNFLQSHGFEYVHQFFQPKTLEVFKHWENICNSYPEFSSFLKWILTASFNRLTRFVRYMPQHKEKNVGPLSGALYLPRMFGEINPLDVIERKINSIINDLPYFSGEHVAINTTQSTTSISLIPNNSVDYIFTDPPFGGNIMYSDLNLLWESWLGLRGNTSFETIVNTAQIKSFDDYKKLLVLSLKEMYRILKPGRWLTVEFSNTQAAIWNAIQTALQDSGFVVANVSILDKGRGGLTAITGVTAVKQDLVISAYKPNGGFEERFIKEANTEDGVWDFIGTHLKYLAVTKKNGNDLIPVPERDPRILYDQLISYYVRKGYNIPLSSQEFQKGLAERFEKRDGMYFLQAQVVEYDKARAKATGQVQLSLFVDDEKSAIVWLRDYLRKKPGTYSDIHPNFMQQMSANSWKAGEKQPELQDLLNMNFLRYDGKDEVPSQIHTYLSTNFKDLRNLDKNDETLIAKAKDRWYVPDHNKEADLEKVRVKSLLKEYATYSEGKGKLKEVRREALRTGFKHDYQSKNFANIMSIAKRLKPDIIDEDETLLMYYDYASMVVED